MATYAIGDVQGCFETLVKLLDVCGFRPGRDRLWFTGDLVNRGPRSLETLRFVHGLGESAVSVLGNHDLHLLALRYAGHAKRRIDTLDAVLEADDAETLCAWLRGCPMAVRDDTLNVFMTHAGVPPQWSLAKTEALAVEVEECLTGDAFVSFFEHMYGNEPSRWSDALTGFDRLRAITNYLTRMRLMDTGGGLDFAYKGSARHVPEGLTPWFEAYRHRAPEMSIVFGHWAALGGRTGISDIEALDTGCVWGGGLTALRLDDKERFTVRTVETNSDTEGVK